MYEMNRENVITPPDRIRIVGLGDAGCGIVGRITQRWQEAVATAAVNTDAKALAESTIPVRMQIGKQTTKGFGAGGDPDLGRRAAEEDAELLKGLLTDTDLLLLVVGLGGGTATGAAPVLVRLAHEVGAMTLCFAALPFQFEGKECRARADEALFVLVEGADTVVVVPNDRMLETALGDTSLKDAFLQADDALSMGISAIWNLVSKRGLINLDFADLKNLSECSGGSCTLGYGKGSGIERSVAAANAALSCPMLGADGVSRAESLLVSIGGGSDLTLKEINEVMACVGAKAQKSAKVFMGAVVENEPTEDVFVTIVASECWSASVRADVQTNSNGVTSNDGVSVSQPDLALATPGKGRFRNVEPTIFEGQDLDVPTFVRRGIFVERLQDQRDG